MDFLKQNGGKIVIAIIMLSAAGWMAMGWFQGSGLSNALPNTIQYVCAETGEKFNLPRGEAFVPPRTNPKTGEATLFSIFEGPDGDWMASDRMSDLLEELGDRNKWIDLETMKLRSQPG